MITRGCLLLYIESYKLLSLVLVIYGLLTSESWNGIVKVDNIDFEVTELF